LFTRVLKNGATLEDRTSFASARNYLNYCIKEKQIQEEKYAFCVEFKCERCVRALAVRRFSMRHPRKMPGSHSGGVSPHFPLCHATILNQRWLLEYLLFHLPICRRCTRASRTYFPGKIFSLGTEFSTTTAVFFPDCCPREKPRRITRVAYEDSPRRGEDRQ